MKRKKKTALPKLTILAYSRHELERFSAMTELFCTAVFDLTAKLDRLEALVTRSEAAKKANTTRSKTAKPSPEPETDKTSFGQELMDIVDSPRNGDLYGQGHK